MLKELMNTRMFRKLRKRCCVLKMVIAMCFVCCNTHIKVPCIVYKTFIANNYFEVNKFWIIPAIINDLCVYLLFFEKTNVAEKPEELLFKVMFFSCLLNITKFMTNIFYFVESSYILLVIS